jgi:hypothetical protein
MSNVDAYATGFAIGNLLFILLLVAIFWFAGRWGLIGIIIRIICGALLILRLIGLLQFIPSS